MVRCQLLHKSYECEHFGLGDVEEKRIIAAELNRSETENEAESKRKQKQKPDAKAKPFET
jgi:hypothetical protein